MNQECDPGVQSFFISMNNRPMPERGSGELCLPTTGSHMGLFFLRGAMRILIMLVLIFVFAGTANAEIKASWYSLESLKKEGTFKKSKGIMANGKEFKDENLTCACRLFPLGATLSITNRKNSKTVRVVVTDRIGKRFATSRIDLSKSAFKQIADLRTGLIPIEVRRIQ